MQEILPGVVHYHARHPNLGADVSCYWLAEERVLVNPLRPPGPLGGEPVAVVLTNRHHLRDAGLFGVPVLAPRSGLGDLPEGIEGFDDGDELPGGLRAHGVLPEWPDEFAIEIPRVRALALADGIIGADGTLVLLPASWLGDEAEEEHAHLRRGYARVVETIDFDAALPAHGDPVTSGAREAIRAAITPG
jgi:hypothetical protein